MSRIGCRERVRPVIVRCLTHFHSAPLHSLQQLELPLVSRFLFLHTPSRPVLSRGRRRAQTRAALHFFEYTPRCPPVSYSYSYLPTVKATHGIVSKAKANHTCDYCTVQKSSAGGLFEDKGGRRNLRVLYPGRSRTNRNYCHFTKTFRFFSQNLFSYKNNFLLLKY